MNTSDYTPKQINNFWAKVNKQGSIPAHRPELGNCWEWIAAKHGQYGAFQAKRKSLYAHRVAWEITNGLISDGLLVLHKCDNCLCCNPDHLFLGSYQDNMDDMRSKGRSRYVKGEATSWAKLTQTDVDEIRRRYSAGGISQKQLGDEMGVSHGQIYRIVHRKNWG